MVQDLGLNLTDEEMDEMILEADPSGDGRVSYQGNMVAVLDTPKFDTLYETGKQ